MDFLANHRAYGAFHESSSAKDFMEDGFISEQNGGGESKNEGCFFIRRSRFCYCRLSFLAYFYPSMPLL